MKQKTELVRPSVKELENELRREEERKTYRKTLRNSIFILVIVSSITVLVATLFFPVLRIYGSSMTPTLQSGDVVLTFKTTELKRNDIVAFYYNNKILVKRVIATQGEWVDIDEEGNVRVDEQLLDEPYILDKTTGECDIELPYQVPEGRVFVMGDHRSVSIDSRSSSIGSITKEQIVGKLIIRLWPLQKFGTLDE